MRFIDQHGRRLVDAEFRATPMAWAGCGWLRR
jgi:hypothetical protein